MYIYEGATQMLMQPNNQISKKLYTVYYKTRYIKEGLIVNTCVNINYVFSSDRDSDIIDVVIRYFRN